MFARYNYPLAGDHKLGSDMAYQILRCVGSVDTFYLYSDRPLAPSETEGACLIYLTDV